VHAKPAQGMHLMHCRQHRFTMALEKGKKTPTFFYNV
jgi:hypothetical protein